MSSAGGIANRNLLHRGLNLPGAVCALASPSGGYFTEELKALNARILDELFEHLPAEAIASPLPHHLENNA